MIGKIIVGLIIGALVGVFITLFFLPTEAPTFMQLFWTKITAASIVTGFFCGIYAHLSKSKLQIFLVSILIGAAVFGIKYLITGHNYDPLTMGAFTGALVGAVFAIIRQISFSIRIMKQLENRRKSGFTYYE